MPVGTENIAECLRVFEEWCEKNESDCRHPDNCERLACKEFLKKWARFELKGALVRVDGKAEAFTIGEKLNEDMAVVRVEKGNLEIHGIYAFINRILLPGNGRQYKVYQLGRDMVWKVSANPKSYFPAFMVNKYLVRCHMIGAAFGGKNEQPERKEAAYFKDSTLTKHQVFL